MVIFHSYVSLPEGIFPTRFHEFPEMPSMWGPPDMFVGLDSPHEYYSYLRTINHIVIGVTNQLSYLGGPTLLL